MVVHACSKNNVFENNWSKTKEFPERIIGYFKSIVDTSLQLYIRLNLSEKEGAYKSTPYKDNYNIQHNKLQLQ